MRLMITGPFAIQPGIPYVSTYRFFVHEGKPDLAVNDRLWEDFVMSRRLFVLLLRRI